MENPGEVYTIANSNQQPQQPASATRPQGSALLGNVYGLNGLVKINNKASIFKQNNFYRKLIVALLMLVLLFLIIVIVLLGICITGSCEDYCVTTECLRSASNLKLSMDFSVDPCEDFYKYTCGHWSNEHPNHGWYPTFSSFEIVEENITIAIMKFLQTEQKDDEPKPVKQVRDFYKSCMDIETINDLGYSVIYKYLEGVQMPVIPAYFQGLSNKKQEKYYFDWITKSVNINKVFAVGLIITMRIDADIYNRTNNAVYLTSQIDESPLPSPFKRNKKAKSKFLVGKRDKVEEDELEELSEGKVILMKIIQEIIKNSDNSTEISDEVLGDAVNTLYNITATIFEITQKNDTTVEDEDSVQLKVDELQNLTDKAFNERGLKRQDIWKTYLEVLFANQQSTFDFKNDRIYILKSDLGEIINLVTYAFELPDIDLELYFWWIIVKSMIGGTTTGINALIYENSVYNNIAKSRALECAQIVNTYMGIAVTYGIADRNFENNTLPQVEQILSDMKLVFEENVWDMDWLDPPTKMATIEKSKEMIELIGYPNWLFNKSEIEDYYKDIVIRNDTYMENLMSIVGTYVSGMLDSFGEVNYKKWRTDPTVVNAFNFIADNSINIPLAILTYPIYHLGLEALNYGAIGTIVGHELIHGFDNLGKKYDKEGNMIEWWTNKTAKIFDEKATCFIKQYDNFSFTEYQDEIKVNGKSTLAENLADNGGLSQAFYAYKGYVKKYGEEKRLPGFEDFSSEQLFFISFSSVWCEDKDEKTLRDSINIDDHSPNYFRVIGSLQNSNEFADAFKCKKGSRMNPNKSKCKIW